MRERKRMEEELKKIMLLRLPNPFNQGTEFEYWNQWDIALADFHNAIQEMRNLLCDCTVRPRRTKEQLDDMIKKIREAN